MQFIQQWIEKQSGKDNKKRLLLCAVGTLAGYWAISIAARKYGEHKMNKICKRKRRIRDQAIQEYFTRHKPCNLSDNLKRQILDSNVTQLKKLLYDRQITVKQLLLFFIERTLDIGVKLNLITEINFDEALIEADSQDSEISKDPNVIFQHELFGIPITIKDTFIQKNFDNTYGVASRCFKPATQDGMQVAHIRQARGICFVRTNVPQLAMTFESTNFIFGRALNPWDTTRAVGGSSGGEAAMLASRCSVIGIGSDIGGSIRIPSAFCGVYGLKPGVGRISEKGEGEMEAAVNGMLNIRPSKGPMARCVDDLIILSKVLFRRDYYENLNHEQQDFYWQPEELKELPQRKLKIGYIEQFNELTPPNCMKRGVFEACEALRRKGHEVVPFQIDKQLDSDLVAAFPKIVSAEGGFRSFQDNLKGEKIIAEYELMEQGTNVPNWVMTYFALPFARLLGQETLYKMGQKCLSTDVYGFLVNSGLQKNSNEAFLRLMRAQQIDAIICPGFGLPAVKHGFSKELPLAALYTWVWNTMDVPVGSLPVTVVQAGNDQQISGKENSWDFIYCKMRESMKGSQGLPVNVQVMSYPYHEEVCLKLMKDIEDEVRFNQKYPYPNL